MKKLILSILCALALFTAKAQTYYPLLDSTNSWSYTSFMLGVRLAEHTPPALCDYPFAGFFTASRVYTTQDTVINANTYKQLIGTSFGFGDTCLYGFMREDTMAQKVYFRDVLDAPEVLLYDFSMQTGDSIHVDFLNSGGYFKSGYYVLDSIGAMNIHAGARRVFYLNCSAQYGHTLIWVEGVGNLGNAVYPYSQNAYAPFSTCPDFPHDFSQFMICFEHNQKVYYDSCALDQASHSSGFGYTYVDSCTYWYFTGGVNEADIPLEFNITPNPSSEKIIITVKKNQPAILNITNALGQEMLSCSLSFGESSGGGRGEVDVSKLPAGIYFVQLRTEKGSVTKKLVKE